MESPDTVTQAINLLREQGYDLDFDLFDGQLMHEEACVSCAADEAVVERLFRFEGMSDPGDEMVVLGLLDPGTGRRGVLASAFGLAADPEIVKHLTGFTTRFPGR